MQNKYRYYLLRYAEDAQIGPILPTDLRVSYNIKTTGDYYATFISEQEFV